MKIDNRYGPKLENAAPEPPGFARLIADYQARRAQEIASHEARAIALEQRADAAWATAETFWAKAAECRRAKKPGETAQHLAHAETLRAQAKELRGQAEDERARFAFVTSRLNGARGAALLFDECGGKYSARWLAATDPKKQQKAALDAYLASDAGHAQAAATNATLWVAGFAYGTHEPRRGVLSDVPRDGKVRFVVTCTPSSHYGAEETSFDGPPLPGSQRANFEANARTNAYRARVSFQGPNDRAPRLLQSVDFKVNGKTPEYATRSPELVVDTLALGPGKLIIEGYCSASAGVGGYCETRQTVIELG